MTAESTWTVPGYVADQFVTVGALGEVWTGRSLHGGAAVVLDRLGPVDPAVVERIRRHGRLPAGGHPHLLPVRDVVTSGGETVLVRDRAGGGSLATLVLHRGRLSPGEVVTVIGPVASALTRAHAAELVHGAVTPERIVFDVEGRPLLTGLGVDLPLGAAEPARLPPDHQDPAVPAGAPPTARSDVFMLAATGLAALDGSGTAAGGSAEAVRAVLVRAVDPDPTRRPTAAELAAGLRQACRPEPVRLLVPEPDQQAAHPVRAVTGPPSGSGRHRRRQPGASAARRIAVGLTAAVVVLVGGVVWLRSPTAEPQPAGRPVAADVGVGARWLRVLDGLDAIRATAYETGDVAMLGRVWAPGPRLRADAEQLRSLLSTGCTARGVRHRFDRVDVLGVAGPRVRLRVTRSLPASQRLRAGRVIGELAGSPPQTAPVELVATGSGWRLG